MKNEYEVRGDVTAIIINSPKYGQLEALISTDKLDLVKEYEGSWFAVWKKYTKTFYANGHVRINGKQKTIQLQRWITGAPKGAVVDHKNHDTLDNRDLNLTIVTYSENAQNRRGASSNSKSGVRGVSWCKHGNKWRVTIGINRVFKHIGMFDTIEAAELAAIEARARHMPFSHGAL